MATIEERTNKDGSITYRIEIRKKGMKHLFKSFKSREEALEYVRRVEESLDFKNSSLPSFPLDVWIDRYMEENLLEKDPKMVISEKRYLEYWREHLGKEIAIDINSSMIEHYADNLYNIKSKRTGASLSPTSRHHYLKCLRFVYKIAMTKWKWAEKNPVDGVDKHTSKINKHQNKTHVISADKFEKEKEFKESFVALCRKRIETQNLKTKDLIAKTSLSKTTLQALLAPDHNSTIFSMVRLAHILDIELTIKEN